MIVDSGTTDTFLPRELRTTFTKAFLRVAGRPYETAFSGVCNGYIKDELKHLPKMQFVLEGRVNCNSVYAVSWVLKYATVRQRW